MKKLLSVIESNKDYAIEKLRELIRIPTVTPPGENYPEIIEYLRNELSPICDTKSVTMPKDVFEQRQKQKALRGERANLHATLDVNAEKTVILYTHLDVVPVESEGNWSYPPFEGVVENNRVYGRGTADSKSAVAALLTTLRCMDELGMKPKYNLNIALTTDEEIGPYSGLCYFADEGLLSGDYFLCMDGTSDDICVGSNGVISWRIKVHGKSCHSGSSFLGVNAIEESMGVMSALKELKRETERRKSGLEMSAPITEETGFKKVKPVLNICKISGGTKNNIIPGECTLSGDRRFIPEEDVEGVVKEMEEALNKVPVDMDWTWRLGYPAMLTNKGHPWVKKVQKIASDMKGNALKPVGLQGSLDVAYAIQQTKQPVAIFGVGRILESNVHAADENVRVDDLVDYTKFLGMLLTSE